MDHETTNENGFRLKSYKLPHGVYEQHEANTIVWTCDFSKANFAQNHTFFSGTYEGLIKTWNCFSEKPLSTFQAHRLPIKCPIYLSNTQIASGSQDKTIKIWTPGDETSEFICTKALSGHQGGIKCLLKAKDENMIFSGSCDTTIKMWHLNMGICLRTFQGHEERVDCLELNRDKSKLLSGSKDATIKI
jgi:WD40 repeat protein